jgi:L-2-hydroxyglutarate oxidase
VIYDVAVIGGGIVGLATAHALSLKLPKAHILMLEKEASWAAHQTGHNSGVIHSGIYYRPGSFKAQFAKAGSQSMVAFCRQHGIAHDVCGKVIVATSMAELRQLEALYQRGLDNGLKVSRLDGDGVRDYEPHVQAVAGIHVPTTGIVDYKAVACKLAELIKARGGILKLNTPVTDIAARQNTVVIQSHQAEFEARLAINCTGLHSDRMAKLAGANPQVKIVPFRGEYYELVPDKRHLVKGLIYPVPNPDFPFLGVHLTRMIDGSVHAGPNAVLGLKREGYSKFDVSLRDLAEVLSYSGFWELALANWREGGKEVVRSWHKGTFVRSLQALIPELTPADVVPSHAGVRAQALRPDGALVDDFLIVEHHHMLHVCNAPSPAATAALEIGQHIASRTTERLTD